MENKIKIIEILCPNRKNQRIDNVDDSMKIQLDVVSNLFLFRMRVRSDIGIQTKMEKRLTQLDAIARAPL